MVRAKFMPPRYLDAARPSLTRQDQGYGIEYRSVKHQQTLLLISYGRHVELWGPKPTSTPSSLGPTRRTGSRVVHVCMAGGGDDDDDDDEGDADNVGAHQPSGGLQTGYLICNREAAWRTYKT